MKLLLRGAFCTVLLVLAACSSLPSPYRIDVIQGNYITQEMVARLEKNMRAEQVRVVLGTPLLRDPLHQYRWDYFFSFQQGGGKIEQRRLVAFFNTDGRLDHIVSDPLPSEEDFRLLQSSDKNTLIAEQQLTNEESEKNALPEVAGQQISRSQQASTSSSTKSSPTEGVLIELADAQSDSATATSKATTIQDTHKAELLAALQLWGDTWLKQDTERHLLIYSDEFKGNMSTSLKWRLLRQNRIVNNHTKAIHITKLYIHPQADDTYLLVFTRELAGELVQEFGRFALKLRKQNGNWRIIDEFESGALQ